MHSGTYYIDNLVIKNLEFSLIVQHKVVTPQFPS